MEELSIVKVYARCNEAGHILDVSSSAFLPDPEGWVQIDEGEGDRYTHAQGNYFLDGCMDDLGVPLYEVVDGAAAARPDEDVAADRAVAEAQRDAQAAATADLDARQRASVALAMMQAEGLPDEQAIQVPALYDHWAPGHEYQTGERRREGEQLYKCLQGHTSQEGWEPSATPALWVEVADPSEEWPLIPNPIPATNPWMAGQKGRVADGRRYISLIDNNTWQPEEYPAGWEEQQ